MLLAVFVALELFTRFQLFKMSKDFVRFMTFDERARSLATAGASVALVGNSATQHGVDPKVVAADLSARCGVGVVADVLTADASRVNTWRYVIESSFWRRDRKPSFIVITFYEDDLADGNRIEIGRVAQFFTTVKDWPEVFRTDLTAFGERAEFVVSSLSATYAARARIRERVLGLLPGYRRYLPHLNDVIFEHEKAAAARAHGGGQRKPTHRALVRLLERAREEGSRLIFVAYPTLEAARGNLYPLEPNTVALLREGGAQLVDLRRLDDIPPELYEDDVHLGEEGRRRYSRKLAALLPCSP